MVTLSQEEVTQGHMVRVNDDANPVPDMFPSWETLSIQVASPSPKHKTHRVVYISFDPQRFKWAGHSGTVEVYRIGGTRYTLEPVA